MDFFELTYASQRLGRESVEHCLKLFRKDQSVEKLIVTTSQFAYRFFEKFGYTIKRIEKEYWGKGLDLYEMEKSNS